MFEISVVLSVINSILLLMLILSFTKKDSGKISKRRLKKLKKHIENDPPEWPNIKYGPYPKDWKG